jgi:hypothetical protein
MIRHTAGKLAAKTDVGIGLNGLLQRTRFRALTMRRVHDGRLLLKLARRRAYDVSRRSSDVDASWRHGSGERRSNIRAAVKDTAE